MFYGKECHLPLELVHNAYWTVKFFYLKEAGKERLLYIRALRELRNNAYEIARLSKQNVEKWHDRKMLKWMFSAGDNSSYLLTP